MDTRRIVALAALGTLGGAAALAVFLAERPMAPGARFRPAAVPGEDFALLPESGRTFARVVIGLRPHGTSRKNASRGARNPRAVELRRRLFGIDFELLHGACMSAAPAYSTFFVAVPDPATVLEASGEEEADFRSYLESRLGWPEAAIRSRVRFFRVSRPLLYPQDMAEILGLDTAGRLVLGVGADTDLQYIEPVETLVREFPRDFALRRLAGLHVGDVNTEGGDLALSWLPDGKVGLLVGRHRAVRYLERLTGSEILGRPLTEAEIDESRRAFSLAFFGVEVVIAGEAALRDPSRGSEELFHADMVVAAVRNDHEALAFVPTYVMRPRDANSGELFPEAFVRDVQREYDLVAGQMEGRGYRVVRLPFEDHPVRAPVNVSKFVDRTNGRPVVLLGRYPEHRPAAPGEASPMLRLADAVVRLQSFVDAWEERPEEPRWAALQTEIENAWKQIDAATASPNDLFEAQRALYEANGISVVPLPLYPSGEGGVHCLLLR
ncbi:MAG TPA: hypothetical protein PLB01_11430 [Thermoanaerobaculia bacterium]|nr:hypothetical protein [Thermoanaerobaculia bacterium]